MFFYKEIKGAPRCFETKGVDAVPPQITKCPPCPTKFQMIKSAISILEGDIASLKTRTSSIKSALLNELTTSCYTVVACKSGATGEITDKEIDLMVNAVVNKSVAQLNTILTTFTNMSVSNPADPCATEVCNTTALDAATVGYGVNNNQLPFSVLTECQDIILASTNKSYIVQNSRVEVTLFSECDQKIIDMLMYGDFIPYIPGLANTSCSGKVKPDYIDPSTPCVETSCGPYSEKVNCSNTKYKFYSKTYPVTAGPITQ